MENDKLGMISNQHLQLADQQPMGTLDRGCIQLAALASTAVDYSKTGIPADMSRAPRPAKFKPDYMVCQVSSVCCYELTVVRPRPHVCCSQSKDSSISKKKTASRMKLSTVSMQIADQCVTMRVIKHLANSTETSTSDNSWPTCRRAITEPPVAAPNMASYISSWTTLCILPQLHLVATCTSITKTLRDKSATGMRIRFLPTRCANKP